MAHGGRSCQSRRRRIGCSTHLARRLMGMTPTHRRPRAYAEGAPEEAASLEDEIERLLARVSALEDEKAALEGFAAVAAHELVVPLVMAESYASIVGDRLDGHEHADSRRDLDALGR